MINLSQDIPSFVSSFPRLPSDVDIVIARKEGSNNHHDFCVRRSKILTPLQWLVANNIYFNDITISYDNLSALPENDHVTNIPTISVSSDDTYFDDQHDLSTSTTEDHYNSNLCRTFVPLVHQTRTEKENIRQSLQLTTTVPWPARGENPLNEFQCEEYITRAFPALFPTSAAEF